MKIKVLSTIILVLYSYFLRSQCEPENSAFVPGEKISYMASYNWGFIWLDAGSASFSADTTSYENKKAWLFQSTGMSEPGYDWIMKVRDYFTAYADYKNLKPLKFVRDTYEGGYIVNNTYYFDHTKKLIYSFTENSDTPFKSDTLVLDNCIFDLLTAVYYARTIQFEDYNTGDKIPLTFIVDGKISPLYMRYLGEEKITTRFDKTYDCLKFKPLLVEGTIFTGGENMTVWITNDANRLPVLIQADILVGSIKATLFSAEGLKSP